MSPQQPTDHVLERVVVHTLAHRLVLGGVSYLDGQRQRGRALDSTKEATVQDVPCIARPLGWRSAAPRSPWLAVPARSPPCQAGFREGEAQLVAPVQRGRGASRHQSAARSSLTEQQGERHRRHTLRSWRARARRSRGTTAGRPSRWLRPCSASSWAQVRAVVVTCTPMWLPPPSKPRPAR